MKRATYVLVLASVMLIVTFGISHAMMGGHSGGGKMGSGSMGSGHQGTMGSSSHGMASGKGHGGMMSGVKLFEHQAFGMSLEGTLVDVKAQMEKMGKSAPKGITHHIMITPSERFSKGTEGTLTITYPGGEKREVGLMAMGNHMGADLNLTESGKYAFTCRISSGDETSEIQFEYDLGN